MLEKGQWGYRVNNHGSQSKPINSIPPPISLWHIFTPVPTSPPWLSYHLAALGVICSSQWIYLPAFLCDVEENPSTRGKHTQSGRERATSTDSTKGWFKASMGHQSWEAAALSTVPLSCLFGTQKGDKNNNYREISLMVIVDKMQRQNGKEIDKSALDFICWKSNVAGLTFTNYLVNLWDGGCVFW